MRRIFDLISKKQKQQKLKRKKTLTRPKEEEAMMMFTEGHILIKLPKQQQVVRQNEIVKES